MEFGGAGSHIERYVVTGVFWYLTLLQYVSLREIAIHCALNHVALVRKKKQVLKGPFHRSTRQKYRSIHLNFCQNRGVLAKKWCN